MLGLAGEFLVDKRANPDLVVTYGSNTDKWATVPVVPADKQPTYIIELDKQLSAAVATTASKKLPVVKDENAPSALARAKVRARCMRCTIRRCWPQPHHSQQATQSAVV